MAVKVKGLTLDVFRAANAMSAPACSLAAFLKRLPPSDAAAVRGAIADSSVQSSAVIRVIKPLGYQFTDQVIRRHRTSGCRACGIEALGG